MIFIHPDSYLGLGMLESHICKVEDSTIPA